MEKLHINIKQKAKRAFAAAVSAVLVACMTTGCYLLPDEEEVLAAPTVKASEVKYTTVTAQRKDLVKKVVNSGTVTAEKQYSVSYEKQGGTISAFYVRAGDTVNEGDPICELDTTDIDYQIEEKELYLKKAQLNVDIIAESGGTQSEIDHAYVDVELLNNELEKLYETKEASTLRAPVSGTVSEISDVRVGDNVNTGQTVATVIDTTGLYIPIKPTDSRVFEMNQEVQIRIDDVYYTGQVFMTPDALSDYLDEQAESHDKLDDTGISYESDTVYVRFVDDVPTDAVGQLADCILVQDSVSDAIVISNNLIKTVDGEQVVYVLKDGEKSAVPVEVGLQTGSQSEIISGLNEGDEIVIR